MKTIKLGNRSMLVLEKGEIVKKLFPMFEIVSCPSFSFKEMRRSAAKQQGLLVVEKEKAV